MANSNTQTTVTLEPKEAYSVINSSLPNIVNYLKVVLKKEKLSEEAEAKRQKYELILNSLEHGLQSGARPLSIVCDDDNGYFSANRSRGIDDPEQQKLPHLSTNVSGYLLWQDEKGRWRRCWCKAENRDLRFYIYEDSNADVLLRSFSLENTQAQLEDQVMVSGKDNSFLLSGVLFDAIGGSGTNRMEASSTPIDMYFAAYTESEGKKWKDTLHQLMLTSDSILDSSCWLAPILPQDSASSSSSNFSSNRDSMVSNTSSLYRMIPRNDGDGKEHSLADSGRTLSVSKQQQPLPSPPHQPLVPSDDDSTPARLYADEDNVSVGTIYESIDNLVLQFDDAIRNMGENIKAGTNIPVKSRKKKERSIFHQNSFLSSHAKKSKSNLWSEKISEFEKGERYSSFMLKKTNSGSWKKKWCVLKGCVFGYYKSRNDSQGREFVILNGKVQGGIQDDKKSFVFSLSCTGVEEMFFSVDDEETYYNWLSKLQTACGAVAEYSHALQMSMGQPITDESRQVNDSLYNVPRTLFPMDPQLYDTPRGNPAVSMTPDAAIDSGIYNVPRALFMETFDDTRIAEDTKYLLGSNPLDIYDYPRVSLSPDEEGIYDDPLDIIDMEIYDYPPDASELGFEEFTSESSRSSTITVSSEFDSRNSREHWQSSAVPPLPSGARPSNLQHESSFEDNQSSTSSINEQSKRYSSMSLNPPSIGDVSGDNIVDLPSTEVVDPSTLEYGQCALRGYLYKKERFMTWVKLFCVIRNNFLECRKSHGDSCSPSLKLFLPGSEVKEGGGDAKKKWAFQIRHPRREGVLVFASDCETDLRRWMKAFQSGTSIQVQPVSTVEEIRITDLEMQKRWTTLDKSNSTQPTEETSDSVPPRRKTFSAGSVPEEFSSDTLKRRSKFSWVKSNFMRRKGEKKILSGSQTDLNTNHTSSSVISNSDLHGPDPLRKSVSLELLPTTTDSDESSQIFTSEGVLDENFQGYLRVQRKGADNVWVRYWCVLEKFTIACYISQRDLTLTLSIQLQGSRVAESGLECQRNHSFKVLHVESGQCLYFAADTHEDFFRWFSEITKCGHQVVSDDSDTTFGPSVHFYFIPKDVGGFKRLSVVSEGGSSNFSEGSTGALTKASTATSIFYRGELLKASHTGKWKQRYCVVNGVFLGVYHSSKEVSPIISIPLHGVSLELISTSLTSKHEYQFKLNPGNDGKSHTFAALSETEMYAWVSALRDASCVPVSHVEEKSGGASNTSSPTLSRSGKSSKRESKKLKDADLVSYIPASSISSPDHSGFLDIQYGTEPWTKYWCIAFGNCLYVYQNKAAASTVKTVVLPGYELKLGELSDTNCPYNFSLHHEGISPVFISVQNQDELHQWATVLEAYTRAEGSSRHRKISGKWMPDNTLAHRLISKTSNGGKKGPVKADHNISGVKADEDDVSSTKQIELFQNYQDLIIRRYEKRIRKTHRVANQTEQKLKKQQMSLLHFKKELSRHVVKLQELCISGDPHAMKRLKSIRTKLLQLDKIVPYLGKYISVNRQAEMQTIAVLKESCTVELQKLSQSMNRTMPVHVTESKCFLDGCDSALPSSELADESQDKQIDENPYASLTEVKQEANTSRVTNYAELDFRKIQTGDSLRPPSVKYSEVRIGATADVNIDSSALLSDLPIAHNSEGCDSSLNATLTEENASRSLNATTEQDIGEIKTDGTYCTPTSDLMSSLEGRQASDILSEQEEPPTPTWISMKKSPPAVAKKPSFQHSDLMVFGSPSIDQTTETQQIDSASSGHEEMLSLQGLPSIMDRIKALQQ